MKTDNLEIQNEDFKSTKISIVSTAVAAKDQIVAGEFGSGSESEFVRHHGNLKVKLLN